MKKTILTIVIAIMILIAYWLISPLFINRKVGENIEEVKQVQQDQVQTLKQGEFVGLAGHDAQGTAKLLKVNNVYFIRLEDNFKVTNGPDLFIYLGKNNKYDPNAKLDALKGNIGGQNYKIPSKINPSDFNEVWIWCRSFSVPFGKAII